MSAVSIKSIAQKALSILQLSVRKAAETLGWSQRLGEYPMAGGETIPFSNASSAEFTTAGINNNYWGSSATLLNNMVDDFTISLWVKSISIPGAGDISSLMKRTVSAGTIPYLIYIDDTGNLRVDFRNSANSLQVLLYPDGANPAMLPVDTWHHVVCYYKSDSITNIAAYVDGVATLKLSSGIPTLQTGNLTLVGADSMGDHVDFRIDEVSIWNKQMTAAQAIEVYNGGTPGDLSEHSLSANLRGWWRFGDITGDGPGIAYDQTGLNNLLNGWPSATLSSDSP